MSGSDVVPEDATATPDELAPDVPVDGRSARAERTRTAIVDALISLLEEGDLQPTANRIADRAGISLRLIYHHFGDLESLYRAVGHAHQRAADRAHPEASVSTCPSIERIDAAGDPAGRRPRVAEPRSCGPRSSASRPPPGLRRQPQRAARPRRARGRRRVRPRARAAAGRASAPRSLSALNGTLFWGHWDDLRKSGRSIPEARAAVLLTVRALFATMPADDRPEPGRAPLVDADRVGARCRLAGGRSVGVRSGWPPSDAAARTPAPTRPRLVVRRANGRPAAGGGMAPVDEPHHPDRGRRPARRPLHDRLPLRADRAAARAEGRPGVAGRPGRRRAPARRRRGPPTSCRSAAAAAGTARGALVDRLTPLRRGRGVDDHRRRRRRRHGARRGVPRPARRRRSPRSATGGRAARSRSARSTRRRRSCCASSVGSGRGSPGGGASGAPWSSARRPATSHGLPSALLSDLAPRPRLRRRRPRRRRPRRVVALDLRRRRPPRRDRDRAPRPRTTTPRVAARDRRDPDRHLGADRARRHGDRRRGPRPAPGRLGVLGSFAGRRRAGSTRRAPPAPTPRPPLAS